MQQQHAAPGIPAHRHIDRRPANFGCIPSPLFLILVIPIISDSNIVLHFPPKEKGATPIDRAALKLYAVLRGRSASRLGFGLLRVDKIAVHNQRVLFIILVIPLCDTPLSSILQA